MTSTTSLIAAVVASAVQRELAEGGRGSMLRIAAFENDEIVEIAKRLRGLRLGGALVEVRVAADAPLEGLDPELLLPPNRTATSYRNDVDVAGFVLLEAQGLSDAQGVKNIRLLDDRSILAGGRDPQDRRRELLNEAWKISDPVLPTLPGTLAAWMETVYTALFGADEGPPPSRRWADFAMRACTSLASLGTAVDDATAGRAVAGALPALDLFPDPALASFSPKDRGTRLQLGRAVSHLCDRRGRQLEPDELAERALSTRFVDGKGVELSRNEQQRIQDEVRSVLYPVDQDYEVTLDLDTWLQLLPEDPPSRGLGERIRTHLEAKHRDLLPEFDRMDLVADLDANDPGAAQRLLESDSAIPDVLTPRLRRGVERLAEPRASSVGDPLVFLLEVLHGYASENGEASPETLELRRVPRASADDSRSVELFAILFGPTLAQVAEDGSTNERFSLTVAPELCSPSAARQRLPEGQHDEDAGWEPVLLEVARKDKKGYLRRVEWRPKELLGFVALRGLLDEAEFDHWRMTKASFEDWCKSWLVTPEVGEEEEQPREGGKISSPEARKPTAEWLELRSSLLHALSDHGLSAVELRDYVAQWSELLARVHDEFEPQGSPAMELATFLSIDTLVDGNGAITMLATHPLRLRWVAEHLDGMRGLLAQCLDTGLELNPVNDGVFFRSLEQRSPHEQPPLLAMQDSLHLAVREDCWHEHFAAVKTSEESRDEWLSDLDDTAIDELARVVLDYIESHPHKRDGVSCLLVVRHAGARFLERFAKKALREGRTVIPGVLHLLAPRSEYGSIERALSAFDDPDCRGNADFPPVDVVLHEWPADKKVPEIPAHIGMVDVAVVPNLFGTHTQALEATDAGGQMEAAFRPWLDAPTYLDDVGSGQSAQNVSRVLLPRLADAILERWSTINVRGFRHRKVGNVRDFMTLQVRFDLSRTLFQQLHRVSQWVATLDPFIGRDQIESLEEHPSVITVRPRVGKSQAYTLVVSSSSGREFIEARLTHRLVRDLPEPIRSRANVMANRLYDVARSLSPGILLRAVGLGWAAQELVGLAVARVLAEARLPITISDGLVAWISLDEHIPWFGGTRSKRADLVRLAFTRAEDNTFDLEVLVIESKLREQAFTDIERADAQLSTTIELLEAALSMGGNGSGAGDETNLGSVPPDSQARADAAIWRMEILEAIEQLSHRASSAGDRALEARRSDGTGGGQIPWEVRQAILRGSYRLQAISGLLCTVMTASPGGLKESTTPQGHRRFDLGRDGLAEALEAVVSNVPLPSTPPPAGRPPSVRPASAPPAPPNPPPVAARHGRIDLEKKYQLVLDTFSEYRVPISRPEGEAFREGPGFFLVRVQPGPGVRPDAVRRLEPELKLKLALPEFANPRSYVDRGCVVFEIPKADDERYFVSAEDIWARSTFDSSRLLAPIGEDIRGDVVGIDFSSSDCPHLLVAGQTGSGKSVALETILLGLTRHHEPSSLRLGLVDPKTTELTIFEESPHLLGPIGADAQDACALLEKAVDEMQRRRDLFRAVGARTLVEHNQKVGGALDRILPWWVLVLDEYADLTGDKDERKEIERLLQRLAQKARASGIHVIVATQRPSVDVISPVIRSNLPAQLALRVRSSAESLIIMAEPGAETLAGKGDAFLRTARGVFRVQCAQISR